MLSNSSCRVRQRQVSAAPGSACLTPVPHGLPGSHLLGATGGHKGPHTGWHAQAGRCHVAQADSVLGEQASQGVHCAPMLQVPHHCDLGEGLSHQEAPRLSILLPISQLLASAPGRRPPWCSMAWHKGTTSQPPPSPDLPWAGHRPHRHAVDSPQLLPDGEDVQQGLGGMLSHPIPSVDHWPPAVLGCQL